MASTRLDDSRLNSKAEMRRYLDAHSMPEPNSGCWLWLLSCGNHGYGQVGWRHSNRTAHRISYIAYRGDIPAGLCVLHKCDVRSCINPDHLFLGTRPDNTADMVAKGRNRSPGVKNPARGPRNGMYGKGHLMAGERASGAKLNEAQVRAIRASTGLEREVAAIYGVSDSLIGMIRNRKVWRHLPD